MNRNNLPPQSRYERFRSRKSRFHEDDGAQDKPLYKAGAQSDDDPWEFVMSTPDRDRVGDIVEQSWILKYFKKNPIALFAHDHKSPIGKWRNVRVRENSKGVQELVGKLELAVKGTSEFIDTLRELVEQRILKAVSVGFYPGTWTAIDEDNPWDGYTLSDNELLECSLVSVGANREALSFAKSYTNSIRRRLFGEDCDDPERCYSAAELFNPEGKSRKSRNVSQTPNRRKSMNLSERIEAKQKRLQQLTDQLTGLTEQGDDGDSMSEEDVAMYQELTAAIGTTRDEIAVLKKAEQAIAGGATKQTATPPAGQAPGTAAGGGIPDGMPSNMRGRISLSQPNKQKGGRAMGTIACMIKAHAERVAPPEIARVHFKDAPEMEVLVRAASNPATMTDANWAAPLVRETWGEFLELIRDMSVYPALPGSRVEFDSAGRIIMPRQGGRGTLAGAWVGEGQPIPVKQGTLDNVDMQPKKMAVISTFTRELGMHSIPTIEGIIRTQLLEDTAEVLDASYLDANARSALRPAGLQDPAETGAPNIVASLGNTVANIIADANGAIGRLLTARAGAGAVWIMNPLRVLGLRNVQDAASGAFPFRTEISNGNFMGYPVLASQNVPVDVVVLQGNSAVTYGNDYAPQIEVDNAATLVMEDTAPEHIVDAGVVTTQPVQSMFQMDGVAVKLRSGLDWRIVRAGGIQVLTGVGW